MSKKDDIKDTNLMKVVQALRESQYPKLFAMDSYVWDGDEGHHSSTDNPTAQRALSKIADEGKEKNFCGTPACALGHFAARTDLQRILKIQRDKEGGAALAMFGSNNRDWDMEAVNEYFGISHEEHEELFGGEGCGDAQTAKQAANYIENFVCQRRKKRKSEESAKSVAS